MRFKTGLSRKQRRDLRRSASRATHRKPSFEQYYCEHRPATAKTFREAINPWRRGELELDDMWEALCSVTVALGHPDSPRSEERAGRGRVWNARADRFRMRHPFVAWRAAVLRARFERRAVGCCFAAWAWHPEGALIGSLARSHGDAFGRGDL